MKYFKHLKDTEMTFYAHFKTSISYCILLQMGALRAALHSLWPDMYPAAVSDVIETITRKLEKRI